MAETAKEKGGHLLSPTSGLPGGRGNAQAKRHGSSTSGTGDGHGQASTLFAEGTQGTRPRQRPLSPPHRSAPMGNVRLGLLLRSGAVLCMHSYFFSAFGVCVFVRWFFFFVVFFLLFFFPGVYFRVVFLFFEFFFGVFLMYFFFSCFFYRCFCSSVLFLLLLFSPSFFTQQRNQSPSFVVRTAFLCYSDSFRPLGFH